MRKCRNPFCSTNLSDLVGPEIVYCGHHQLELIKFGNLLSLRGGRFSEEDVRFMFEHQERCNANQLAEHLKMEHSTLQGYLKRGAIKGEKVRSHGAIQPFVWKIPLDAIEKVIDLVRNWITVNRVAVKNNLERDTLLTYARMGYLGHCQMYFDSGWAIRQEVTVGIAERFEDIKRRRHADGKRWLQRSLSKDETTVLQIARELSVKIDTVYHWIKIGYLPFSERGGKFVLKESDVLAFAQRVVQGGHPRIFSRAKRKLAAFIESRSS